MFFTDLKYKNFGYVNLNEEAKFLDSQNKEVSDYLDPFFCDEFVRKIHKEREIDFSYGGWLEDRSFLWNGGYMHGEEKYLHVGVDFNFSVGTKIYSSYDCMVDLVDCDTPEIGG